jgi:rhodanese-related sulfurtransferase
MSKKIVAIFLCCLFSLSFTASLWAQAQGPAPKQPIAAATPEKKPAEAAAPEKKAAELPKKKQTELGLYVTAKEAYAMWQKEQDKIKILDCRTPEEYMFVGHAPMAVFLPGNFPVYKWDPKEKEYLLPENPKFVALVKKHYKPTDTLLVMCRSGGRSAKCINKLAKAGFKNVYNITDGFEGDKVNDPQSPNHGKRLKNGWKNAGAPWTYDMNPDQTYLPYGKPKK